MSQKHLQRYLDEIGFRWHHRTPVEIVTKHGKKKTVMVSLPVMELLCSLRVKRSADSLEGSETAASCAQLLMLPKPGNLFLDHRSEMFS